ncbi:single-stranded DNA-binding protein, partial [Lactobacillus salivarius]|nr:single-stranded DNA-binding protein [Ligilactobacillus salivarius]
MMNHVNLIGRLTKDIEVKYTDNSTPTATFTLAVPRSY